MADGLTGDISLDFPETSPTNLTPIKAEDATAYINNFQASCPNATRAVLFDFPTIFSHILKANANVDWQNAGFYAYLAQYPSNYSDPTKVDRNTIILQFVENLNSTTSQPSVIQGVGPLNMGDLCPLRCLPTGGL
jgi:hypothetical protein